MLVSKTERSNLHNIDWALLVIILSICAIGIINIYSASYTFSAVEKQLPFYVKQIQWVLLGLIAMRMRMGNYKDFPKDLLPEIFADKVTLFSAFMSPVTSTVSSMSPMLTVETVTGTPCSAQICRVLGGGGLGALFDIAA